MSGREAALFSRITYVIGPHSTITTKEGKQGLSPLSAVLGLTAAAELGGASCCDDGLGKAALTARKACSPSLSLRLLMDMFSPSKRREREVRSPSPCAASKLQQAAVSDNLSGGRRKEGGCCHVRQCGCITCGGSVDCFVWRSPDDDVLGGHDLERERMMRQRQQPPRQPPQQHTSTESLASVFSQAISILSRTSSNLGEQRALLQFEPLRDQIIHGAQ